MSSKLKNKHKQRESICTSGRQFLGSLLDIMVCVYVFLVIVVMPFYNEEGFARIGTNKAMFFRTISVNGAKLILPVLVLFLVLIGIERWQNDKNSSQIFTKKLSVTDKFALLYGVSLLLSYVFSDYKENILWGADGWYMGLLPQLFLLAIYFMISRFWENRTWMFLLFLPVSTVVFVLGYLNRFGIFPIDMKIENTSFLSTIGNINWYCGYIVSVFFGGYYLLWQNDRDNSEKAMRKNILLIVYVAVGFATLVTQGSLSGLVALAFMLIFTFCLSTDPRRMLQFWQGTLVLSLVCLVTWFLRTIMHVEITYQDSFVDLLTYSVFPIIATAISLIFVVGITYCNSRNAYPAKLFWWLKRIVGGGAVAGVCIVFGMIVLNTLRPGSIGSLSENPFFTFSPTWGSNRGATWKAGIMCFAEQNLLHKLIGVGPDAMEPFLYQNGSSELIDLVKERFGNNRLTNAHCEWLTILVNEGLLGFVGFVGMIVSAIRRFIKYGTKPESTAKVTAGKPTKGNPAIIMGACGFCLLAYTVNNMFSFQQSMSVATIFVILGIGEAYARAYASAFQSSVVFY